MHSMINACGAREGVTLRINRHPEGLGRAAVVAAIAEDRGRLAAALDALDSAGPEVAAEAVRTYLAVARQALLAIHSGTVPDQEQNKVHASDVAAEESKWAAINSEDVFALLEGLSDDQSPSSIAPERVLTTLFLTTGYFLSWYAEGLGYESFYDFLDAILDRLEAERR